MNSYQEDRLDEASENVAWLLTRAAKQYVGQKVYLNSFWTVARCFNAGPADVISASGEYLMVQLVNEEVLQKVHVSKVKV